jgi:hypothetical protein
MIASAAALAFLALVGAAFVLLAGARAGVIRLQIMIAMLTFTALALAAIGAAYDGWSRMDAALALVLAAPAVIFALVGRTLRKSGLAANGESGD